VTPWAPDVISEFDPRNGFVFTRQRDGGKPTGEERLENR
jgi:hypothetical protein